MEEDVLVPTYQKFKIKDRQYSVGKLSLKQMILMSKFIAKTVLSNTHRMAEFRAKVEHQTTNNFQDMMNLIQSLDPNEVVELFGIILNEPDTVFLEENLDFVTSTEIVATLLEVNQIHLLKKSFARINALVLQGEKNQVKTDLKIN